jgi:uncharacterized protein (DUF427 family)
MGRLADGWFPRVEPGPDLDEARHAIATAAAEAGRDPASIGMDGRIRQGARATNDLVRNAQRWREAGATHVSVDTMRSELAGLEAHLGALATAAEALRLGSALQDRPTGDRETPLRDRELDEPRREPADYGSRRASGKTSRAHARCPGSVCPTITSIPQISLKGDARYWTIRVGGKVAENKVWGYPETLPETPPITDHVAFYWDAVEHWYEEDEEVFVHPRDPYHRVDLVPSSRSVRVSLDGVVLAESSRLLACFETGLPTRWYFRKEDLADYEPTTRSTRCPYKGIASYWSVDGNDNIAWSYEDPIAAASPLKGLVAFYDEVVDLDIDGKHQERGYSPFAAAALADRGAPAKAGSNA